MSDFDPEAIDRIEIQVVNGKWRMRVGLEISLFLTHDRSEAAQDQLARATETYLAAFGPAINWFHTEQTGRYKRVTGATLLELPQSIRSADPATGLGVNMHGGSHETDAHPLHFNLYASPLWKPRGISFLKLGASMGNLQSLGDGAFLELAKQISAIAKPGTGNGGLALLTNMAWRNEPQVQAAIFETLSRFPGLNYVPGVIMAKTANTGVPCANWLTVLSNELADELGGANALQASGAASGLSIHRFAGGIIVQAGPVPQLGDPSIPGSPRIYNAAGTLLKAVRAEPPPSLLRRIPGIDVERFTREWLARFD